MIDTADLTRRLLKLLTPSQLELFVTHLEALSRYSHGWVKITRRDGKPDLIAHEGSDKA